jgi:hypothetical protein
MLQHTAGADYSTTKINGVTYKLRPLQAKVYAEMEAYIVNSRPDPLSIASESVKKLPASQHPAIWKAAMAEAIALRIVTAEDLAVFEKSIEGLSWKLWQCLKTDHPEIDNIEAAKILLIQAGQENFERLVRATELASGEAALKKYTGREGAETAQAPAGQ